MKLKTLAAIAAIGSIYMLAGCGTASFYWQAINGQWELTRKSRPMQVVIDDASSAEPLREKLRAVQRMRVFASHELALPDNESYKKYADLKRSFVVWNVFATPEFSTRPKEWCFPFAGCVGYRGYFHEQDARKFGERLRQQGLDVFVGGVPAYSTLGYFDDPVLNTFIGYAESEVARLIFHELAHQVVYVKGDSTFNESFATAVELEGVKRWIAQTGSAEQQRAFDVAQLRKRDFLVLIERHRERLGDLFEESLSDDDKRERKRHIFTEMRDEYARLKEGWGGFSGFDWWFNQSLNNAQLASLAIYTQLVPGFQKVLADRGYDMKAFYAEVKKIAKMPAERRQNVLQ